MFHEKSFFINVFSFCNNPFFVQLVRSSVPPPSK
eukprot:UN17099